MPSVDTRERYLAEARAVICSATLDDLLSFITVRRIAGGTGTAAFYHAFPGGREELLAELKREAAPDQTGPSTPITMSTVTHAMQLVSKLRDQDPAAVEELQEVALSNFDAILGADSGSSGPVLRGLMTAVSAADGESREQLRLFYDALADEYSGLFGAILEALKREPIEEIGSIRDLTMAISALVAGLSLRARLGQPGKTVLASALLPILAALTVPAGEPSADAVHELLS